MTLPLLTLVAALSAFSAQAMGLQQKTALSLHDDYKYRDGFTHFDYVNPEAPKGGTLRQGAMGTFDSLNPFIEKGTPAAGIGYIYDTLMVHSADEPFALYPLVAESAEPAPDNSSITFHLNPEARFHDGHGITAEDVVFSITQLKASSPFYRTYYRDLVTAEALSKRSVRFIFANNQNPELSLIAAQIPIFPKHFWTEEGHDFTLANVNKPLGSGPYKITAVDPGQSITYSRIEDYWAAGLPANKGRYNFNKIRYDYYRDANVSLQAFKAGEYDIRFENIARNWATAYDVPAVESGELTLETISSKSPAGMQGFVFNIRNPLFSDVRVRRALNYAMDFEWLNKNLFYNSYQRTQSYFENSDMKATGVPTGKELALLEPWREQLPEQLFTEPHRLPKTDGSGHIRHQLTKALPLMEQAGWSLEGGVLQKGGTPFEFEILLYDASLEKVALQLKKNLRSMGVVVTIRTVDVSQYINRLRQFDFDMIVSLFPQSSSPGNEQRDFWGSKAADEAGSRNVIGIKNPVIDDLIRHVIKADSPEDQTAAVRALDRVLLWHDYIIPHWYSPYTRVAYWKPLKHKLSARGQTALYQFDLSSWWYEPTSETPQQNSSVNTNDSDTPNSAPPLLWLLGLIPLAIITRSLFKRFAR